MKPQAKAGVNSKSPLVSEAPKRSCLSEIQRLQKERDERRKNMEAAKLERAAEDQRNREAGNPGDVDFQRMIRKYRENDAPAEQPHYPPGEAKICICVRKRPISSKEVKRSDHDSVTCLNPLVIVHDCKLKVDGISKYLDNQSFEFDHTFHEEDTTESLYVSAVQNLVDFVINGGRATVFAYGQTGSGKTFTMQGIQNYVAEDLFSLLEKYEEENGLYVKVAVSYFEIYGGRCQDLLNSRQRLNVREDGSGDVVVSDLHEMEADCCESLHSIIDTGNSNRTTHATESNDVSSRSHAICQITLRNSQTDSLIGRFSLIDLAGSERGVDTKSHNRQRRMEGAEINKSLLALKECVRALDSGSSHIPYRGSKLTLVLKDSFTNKKSKTVMIANVSPAASSADHTINTLRYADRIKERVVGGQAAKNAANAERHQAMGISPPPQPGNAGRASAAPAAAKGPSRATPPSQQSAYDNDSGSDAKGSNRGAVSKPQSKAQYKDQSPVPPSSNNQKITPRGGAAAPKGPVALPSNGRNMRQELDEESDGMEEGYDYQEEDVNDSEVDQFHRTVQDLFEEEEELLNHHMTIIQENAELLTEEGRLLQQIQGENNDIDAYAARLDVILQRKQELITILRAKLDHFRSSLVKEEQQSKTMAGRFSAY